MYLRGMHLDEIFLCEDLSQRTSLWSACLMYRSYLSYQSARNLSPLIFLVSELRGLWDHDAGRLSHPTC